MSQKKFERQSISKSIRFEVFKRDKFTCQYCGKKAPDITLHVDHIDPVSKGGNNDLLNLITSCIDCNLGKSDRTLSDTTIIDRKRTQMEDLQERREQIQMMMEWQRGLVELDQYLIEEVAKFWAELVEPYYLSDQGLKSLKKLLKQNSADEVMEAMRISSRQYLQYENSELTQESVQHAWSKIGGICKTKKIEKIKPYMRDLLYIRGILRNRLNYINERSCLQLLEQAYQSGVDIEKLREHSLNVRNWTQWRQNLEDFIAESTENSRDSNAGAEVKVDEPVNNESSELDQGVNARVYSDQTKIESTNQFIEVCESYAKAENYIKIAELCNQYLDPKNLEVRDFLSTVQHWLIDIWKDRFVVDFNRLKIVFELRYKHWFIDYKRRCICTADGGNEYDIGFETIHSDERKQEWVNHLSDKNWSSPEMIAELTEILKNFLYILLISQISTYNSAHNTEFDEFDDIPF